MNSKGCLSDEDDVKISAPSGVPILPTSDTVVPPTTPLKSSDKNPNSEMKISATLKSSPFSHPQKRVVLTRGQPTPLPSPSSHTEKAMSPLPEKKPASSRRWCLLPLFTSMNILLADPTLAKINVIPLFIHTHDHDGLYFPDLDQAADTSDPTAGELGEEDHTFRVVLLEERNVGSHVGDVLDLNHHCHVHFQVPGFVHAAL